MRPRDPRVYLTESIEAAERIASFVHGRSLEDYEADAMLRSAVERQFEIIGEALRRLAEVSPWLASSISGHRRIVGFRNQLAHGYFAIQHDVVWAITQNDLSLLASELRLALERSSTTTEDKPST